MQKSDGKGVDFMAALRDKQQKGYGAGMSRKTPRRVKIDKVKFVSDEYSRRMIPTEFALPFDPLDPWAKTEPDYRFPFIGMSATKGYLEFKKFVNETIANGEMDLSERLCEMLETPDLTIMHLEDTTTMTPGEIAAFKKCRRIRVGSTPIFATQFSNRKNTKFPRIYALPEIDPKHVEYARIQLGEIQDWIDTLSPEEREAELKLRATYPKIVFLNNIPVREDSAYYFCYAAEQACLAYMVDKIHESYKEGGVNEHRTEKQKQDEIKAVWRARLVSRPYYKYVLRFMYFVADQQTYIPNKEFLEAYNKNNFVGCDRLRLLGRDSVDALQKLIGGKDDQFFDFIELGVLNPEIPPDQQDSPGALVAKVTQALANRSDSLIVEWEDQKNPGQKLPPILKEFVSKYREYLDNPEMWKDEIIRENVTEFRTIAQDTLLQLFQHDIGCYAQALLDPEISKLFKASSEEANTELTRDLMRTMVTGAKDEQEIPDERIDDIKDPDSEIDYSSLMAPDAFAAAAAPVETTPPAPVETTPPAPVETTPVAPVTETTPVPTDTSATEDAEDDDAFASFKSLTEGQ